MCSCGMCAKRLSFHLLELRHSGSYVYTTEPKTPRVCSSLYTKLSSILDLFLAVKKTHSKRKYLWGVSTISTNSYWAFSIYCRPRVLSSLFLRLLIKHFLCVRHYSKHLVDTTKTKSQISRSLYSNGDICTNLSMTVMNAQQNKTSNRA